MYLSYNLVKSISKLMIFIIGIFLTSIGTACMIRVSYLGLHPWDAFFLIFTQRCGLTIGTWNQMASLVYIVITILITKQFPSLGTVADMILYGLFVDWSLPFLMNIEIATLELQWMCYLTGIFLCAFGSGMYLCARLGTGPVDGFIMAISHKAQSSYANVYMINLCVGLVGGYLMGGSIGLGTLLTSFLFGPIYQFSFCLWNQIISMGVNISMAKLEK